MNKEQAIEYLFYSLGATIILLIGILSPNIVYLIHKKWFTWKKHRICLNCNKDYGLVDVDVESCENCGHYLYNKTKMFKANENEKTQVQVPWKISLCKVVRSKFHFYFLNKVKLPI